MTENDYCHAVISGSRAAGSLGCTGDGVPPFIIDSAEEALKAEQGYGIPFVKPWEGKELYEKAERMLAQGCPALGIDVDAAGLITLRKMGRPVAPMSQKTLEDLVAFTHDAKRPLIIKGIMTPEAARRVVDAGVDAIVVSNHGGRVLDHCPGTAEVLPMIAEAVRGHVHIFVDGGVRTGVDVLKMLALGAEAVLIGRPVSVMAIGGGLEAVKQYFEGIKAQLEQAMLLTGCASLSDISERILYRG